MKLLHLHKLKLKKKIMDNLVWDLTPKMVAEAKQKKEIKSPLDIEQFKDGLLHSQGYYFCIDFWEDQPNLVLKRQGKMVAEVIGRVDDVPENLLLDAMADEAGIKEANQQVTQGANEDCAINEEIKTWLKGQLY